MVRFNIVASIALGAFLFSSVTSTPVPVEVSNISTRDFNDLQPRNFLSSIFGVIGKLVGGIAKLVRKVKAKSKPKPKAQKHLEDYNSSGSSSNNNNYNNNIGKRSYRRDLSARSRGNMKRRDILEERGGDGLDRRGDLDELD